MWSGLPSTDCNILFTYYQDRISLPQFQPTRRKVPSSSIAIYKQRQVGLRSGFPSEASSEAAPRSFGGRATASSQAIGLPDDHRRLKGETGPSLLIENSWLARRPVTRAHCASIGGPSVSIQDHLVYWRCRRDLFSSIDGGDVGADNSTND